MSEIKRGHFDSKYEDRNVFIKGTHILFTVYTHKTIKCKSLPIFQNKILHIQSASFH